DASGGLWVGTAAGLDFLPAASTRFERFRVAETSRPAPAANSVRALDTDDAGNLWIGTEDSLSRWSDHGRVRRRYGEADGLARGMAGAIQVDASGGIWVG